MVTLLDTEHGVPILRQTTSMVRRVHNILEIKGDTDAVRTITLADGSCEQLIINSVEDISAGHPDLPWEEALRQRQYEKRMEELTRRRGGKTER